MAHEKTDLRVLRTRKLIMDAFFNLSSEKDFKDITIKNITEQAMINRATFYYHFEDKYDLLEKILSEELSVNLDCHFYENNELNETTFVNLFKAITYFQQSLPSRCQVGYDETKSRIIRSQLEVIFQKLLEKEYPNDDPQHLQITAVMYSWGLYGASLEWNRDDFNMSPEQYIKATISYILPQNNLTYQE